MIALMLVSLVSPAPKWAADRHAGSKSKSKSKSITSCASWCHWFLLHARTYRCMPSWGVFVHSGVWDQQLFGSADVAAIVVIVFAAVMFTRLFMHVKGTLKPFICFLCSVWNPRSLHKLFLNVYC